MGPGRPSRSVGQQYGQRRHRSGAATALTVVAILVVVFLAAAGVSYYLLNKPGKGPLPARRARHPVAATAPRPAPGAAAAARQPQRLGARNSATSVTGH